MVKQFENLKKSQLHVALYEAIWSYLVYSLLSLWLLATETSLKARIDTTASIKCPLSFRLVLEVTICDLGLFFSLMTFTPKIKHFHFFL